MMGLSRRKFAEAMTFVGAVGIGPALRVCSAATVGGPVRIALALRVAFQSVLWVAVEAGFFGRYGIEASFATLAAGGPRALAGTISGEWEFCHTGDLPIVQGVLRGDDPVLILTPTELHEGVFLMSRHEIRGPGQLTGRRIGAVDATGQLGRALQALLAEWRVSANVVSLGSFQSIHAALVAGRVDAGYLPIDDRFEGEQKFGWNALHGLSAGTGGIVTTRRLIKDNPPLVADLVKACVDAIHLIKTQPDTAGALLQRFLRKDDHKAVADLLAFYVPLFRSVPTPTLFGELPKLKSMLAGSSSVSKLRESDICDTSIVDALERSNYIQQRYAS